MSIAPAVMSAASAAPASARMAMPVSAAALPAVLPSARSTDLPATNATHNDNNTQAASHRSAALTRQSLDEINTVMDAFSISVRFQIDPEYKEPIIKVVDQETGKLIRQIPSEEAVRMAKALDNLKGLLFAQAV